MTPQELERTLDFILQHQAKAAAHLEQLAERQGEMQSMLALITELGRTQSERLDQHAEMFRSMRESFESAQIWQKEALGRLDEILHRLSRNS